MEASNYNVSQLEHSAHRVNTIHVGDKTYLEAEMSSPTRRRIGAVDGRLDIVANEGRFAAEACLPETVAVEGRLLVVAECREVIVDGCVVAETVTPVDTRRSRKSR